MVDVIASSRRSTSAVRTSSRSSTEPRRLSISSRIVRTTTVPAIATAAAKPRVSKAVPIGLANARDGVGRHRGGAPAPPRQSCLQRVFALRLVRGGVVAGFLRHVLRLFGRSSAAPCASWCIPSDFIRRRRSCRRRPACFGRAACRESSSLLRSLAAARQYEPRRAHGLPRYHPRARWPGKSRLLRRPGAPSRRPSSARPRATTRGTRRSCTRSAPPDS